MPAVDAPTVEQDFTLARQAFAEGDLTHAVQHLAGALCTDPTRGDYLALLDDIVAAADDPLALVPLGEEVYFSTAAVRALILAKKGDIDRAVDLLLAVIMARPDIPYLDWATAWLQQPEAAGTLDMERIGFFLGWFWQRYPGLVITGVEERTFLERLLPFFEAVQRSQPVDDLFLFAQGALLRKLGRIEEALTFAQEAYAARPCFHTAIGVGMAHEARGDMPQWYRAYQTALEHDPENVSARLDLADKLWLGLGRLEEAEHWYEEVLERQPDHPWALPSLYSLRYQREGDSVWKERLLTYAAEHPDSERAGDLVYGVTPFFGYLPGPEDATIDALRQIVDKREADPAFRIPTNARLTLGSLEAPSARRALDLQFEHWGWEETLDFHVTHLQEPDPRQPRCPVEYLLWKYRDTQAVPAMREPSAETAAAVAEIARWPYDLKAWSQAARRLGQSLGRERVEDVLGVMLYPPIPADVTRVWLWLQRIQLAAALVLAHLDGGWRSSLRRKVLFDLANGPVDWTVSAALVALTTLAIDDREMEADVTELFRSLMHALPRTGYACHAYALVCCYLQLPHIADEERDTLWAWRRGLEQP